MNKDFVKASFVDPQTREGSSFYDFETAHKHSIVLYYYLAFGLAECLPLLVLARTFQDEPDSARLWRYFLYAGTPLFLACGDQPIAPVQRLWRDRLVRPNLGIYIAVHAIVLAATALFVERHSVANSLLALRGKFAFALGLRVLRRLPLRGREVRFAGLFASYAVCLMLAGRDGLITFVLMLVGGLVFFLEETLFALGIAVAEAEVLACVAHLLLGVLYALKGEADGRTLLRPVPLEALWACTIAGSSFSRFWLLKRLKHIQNDPTAENYNEVLIIFVAVQAILLSLFFGPGGKVAQMLVALIGLTAFVVLREKELKGLINGTRRALPATTEPLTA